MKGYLFLTMAIVFEVMGTSMLKLSDGFTNLVPSIILCISFMISFTMLVFALKTLPLSKAYSIWAGAGTAGTAMIGMIFFNEVFSLLNGLGLIIIIGGIVLLNYSRKPDTANQVN